MSVLIGVIADDFTGATDIANTLSKEGMRVVQVIGVPEPDATVDADAVVVALKSRTAPLQDAISWSMDALEWLLAAGAQQIIFKYCSTFDSTPQGNIGPVADALRDRLSAGPTVICPAFPENGRTVEGGHLMVNGVPLHESPMRDHPLTPMWDSDLSALMSAQSQGDVDLIPLDTVRAGRDAIETALAETAADYVVVDAVSVDDLRAIGRALSDAKLVTGGSGISVGLPQNFLDAGQLSALHAPQAPKVTGRQVILAGSASVATQGQVAYAAARMPAFEVELDRIAQEPDYAEQIARWAWDHSAAAPVMIYGTSSNDVLRRNQEKYGAARAGEMLETTLSDVAVRLAAQGFDTFVVAGGETSGAVVSALNVSTLRICTEIAPGVPWCEVEGARTQAIALKSGNFGAESFFLDALEML